MIFLLLFVCRFMFRTFEANSLIMFNAGKAQDFFSVELINGRLHYTLNLGYGPISVKDETGSSLSDNKWHQVCCLLWRSWDCWVLFV